MDFSSSEEQVALQDLAKKILAGGDDGDDFFHRPTYQALAEAGLLGMAMKADVGGAEMSLLDLLALIREVGRATASVPVLPALVLGAMPVDHFADGALRERLLPGVASGEIILTGALIEGSGADQRRPTTTATKDGGGWRLDGVKVAVPAAGLAHRVVVTAAQGLFLVDPNEATLEAQRSTAGEPWHTLRLDGTPAACLSDDPAAVQWLVDRAQVAGCAMQLGLADEALGMTARYATERQQFGKAIATFQAVSQRVADAYIDLQAIELSMLRAAWKLDAGLPAEEEVAIAAYWAAEGGFRILAAAQHIHGGIGFDRDYPLHRYTLRSKNVELCLGGAAAALERLGDCLRAAPTSR